MITRAQIEDLIPHRDPFLLVDRVLEESEKELVLEWDVPPGAEWFRGHYPGHPILPGAILMEHGFQGGAVFIALRAGSSSTATQANDVPVLTKVEGARFRRVVRPGDTLRTRVTLRELLGPAYFMSARTTCEGERCCDLRFVVSRTGAMAEFSESMG